MEVILPNIRSHTSKPTETSSPITLTIDNLRSLLCELNDALMLEDAAPVEWVVCGGTALALQGLGGRSTRDVDVLGDWVAKEMVVVAVSAFSPEVERALIRVAELHPELRGLGPRWVNTGPAYLTTAGLPEGFATRWTTAHFGERLTLHLLGRLDLIALKLLASADDLGARHEIHLDDLRLLEPTSDELDHAIRWVTQFPDPNDRIRMTLKRLIEDLGHDDLAYYL